MLKERIKAFIQNTTGLRMLNGNHLPIGLDLKADITQKLGIQPALIFDVGANIGQSALYYHQVFPGSVIYSFEPVSTTFKKLTENTRSFSNIKPYRSAFGSVAGEKEILLFPEEQSYLNSLKEESKELHAGTIKEVIRIDTIDDFVQKNHIENIDLLKIDTEGFELQVIRGAENMINNKRVKLIYCETGFSSHDTFKTYFPEILNYLVEKGYILFGFYEMGNYQNINQHIKGGTQYGNALFFRSR
jgi:FkbM family methyltransferase